MSLSFLLLSAWCSYRAIRFALFRHFFRNDKSGASATKLNNQAASKQRLLDAFERHSGWFAMHREHTPLEDVSNSQQATDAAAKCPFLAMQQSGSSAAANLTAAAAPHPIDFASSSSLPLSAVGSRQGPSFDELYRWREQADLARAASDAASYSAKPQPSPASKTIASRIRSVLQHVRDTAESTEIWLVVRKLESSGASSSPWLWLLALAPLFLAYGLALVRTLGPRFIGALLVLLINLVMLLLVVGSGTMPPLSLDLLLRQPSGLCSAMLCSEVTI